MPPKIRGKSNEVLESLDLPEQAKPPHLQRDQATCFVRGTLIETEYGPLPIETLRPGDRVMTLDNGPMTIRWIGNSEFDASGYHAPVRFAAGVLGNYRDLYVSPLHRILINNHNNSLFFGDPQVLVSAKYLVNGKTVRFDPRPTVRYYHLALDSHQAIFSEGIATESLHLGQESLKLLGAETAREILDLFPDVRDGQRIPETVRPCLKAYEGSLIQEELDNTTGVRSSAA